jgi:hypothetical protein
VTFESLLARSTRNRALVLLALIAIAPLALKIVDLPSRSLSSNILGSPVSFIFTTDTLMIVLLPALISAGCDWVLRDHPDVVAGEVPYLFPFWLAPGYAGLALGLLLSRVDTWGMWLFVLAIGVLAIGLTVMAEFVTLSPNMSGFAVARLLLTVTVYGIAFVLFTLIYTTRERSLISATLVVLVSFGLALDLLAPQIIGMRNAVLLSSIVALILGQATWALNYWNISNWSAGVLLLTLFYVMVGLAQQHFQDRLTRNVLIEFGAVTVSALVVAWALAGVHY